MTNIKAFFIESLSGQYSRPSIVLNFRDCALCYFRYNTFIELTLTNNKEVNLVFLFLNFKCLRWLYMCCSALGICQ